MSVLKKTKNYIADNPSIAMIILLLIIGTCVSSNFLTGSNLMSVLRRISVNGLMAAGFTLVLLTGGFDLSIAGTLSLSSCLAVGIEIATGNALLGIMVALLAGVVIGLINGFLMIITRGGSGEAFLITMGTQLLANATAMIYTQGYEWSGVREPWYQFIGQGSIFGVPFALILWIVVMVIFQFIIKKTIFGRELVMCGANKNASYLAGVNVGVKKLFAHTMAGLMAAFAAIVLTARLESAGPALGDGSDFDAAVAAVVGGVSLIGGKGSMVQVFIGAFIFGVITNILNLLTATSDIQYIIKGLILLMAICLDSLKWKRKTI